GSTDGGIHVSPRPSQLNEEGMDLITGLNFPKSLLVQNGTLYYADDTIASLPTGGGTPTVLSSAYPGATLLAVDSANVYFAVSGQVTSPAQIVALPLNGDFAVVLASADGAIGPTAIDSANVYWYLAKPNNYSRDLLRTPLTGGPSVTIAADVTSA